MFRVMITLIAAQAIVEEAYAKVTDTDGTEIKPVGKASRVVARQITGGAFIGFM